MTTCIDCPTLIPARGRYPASPRCASCRHARERELENRRRSTPDGKAKASSRWKAYATGNADLRARRRAAREANRELIAAQRALKHREDPSIVSEQNRLHRLRHPEKHREKARRRRARLKGVIAVPYSDRAIAERDRWLCGLCGGPVDQALRKPDPRSPSIDHIVPISLGGPDTAENVQLAHLGCNASAGPKRGLGVAGAPDGSGGGRAVYQPAPCGARPSGFRSRLPAGLGTIETSATTEYAR